MSAYVLPAVFVLVGLALQLRLRSTRRRGGQADGLDSILSLFALAAGVFLAALAVMCGA